MSKKRQGQQTKLKVEQYQHKDRRSKTKNQIKKFENQISLIIYISNSNFVKTCTKL